MSAGPDRTADAYDVVFYCLGGGRGHVTRGIAIARGLQRLGLSSLVLSSEEEGLEVRGQRSGKTPRGPDPHRLGVDAFFMVRGRPAKAITNSSENGLQAAGDRREAGGWRLRKTEKEQVSPRINVLGVCEAARKEGGASLGRWVADTVQSSGARLLVVDTFASGIRGELDAIGLPHGVRRVLVLRHIRPEALEERGYAVAIRSRYQGVVFCEDSPVLEALSKRIGGVPWVQTAPILIRRHDELPDRAEALALLGLPPDRRAALAVATGAKADAARLAAELDAAWTAAGPNRSWAFATAGFESRRGAACTHWPLMDVLPAVSLVVGPAGYNLFHEANAVGRSAIWLPMAKTLDDQFWRARMRPMASDRLELTRLLARSLSTLQDEPPARVLPFDNGADPAARFAAGLP